MGNPTRQREVTVPSALTTSPMGLPLDRPTSPAGTVSAMSIPSSGSSDGWSLHGHQMSPPSPSLVTPTQGLPDGVSDHTKPSIQGARMAVLGRPPYAISTWRR